MRQTSRLLSSLILVLLVVGIVAGLGLWKVQALRQAEAATLTGDEPMETISVAPVRTSTDQPSSTAIGTVRALQSITLRNELAGTVRQVVLIPGRHVEAGALLVSLDVEVERAELAALEARLALAESSLVRLERLLAANATSQASVDEARAARNVAQAEIARVQAVIARKTLRAPFAARVGLADVHPGQYLEAGTEITTLQAIASAVHVDFAVPQQVATGLRRGATVEVTTGPGEPELAARVVAIDARVDAETRNATIRARVDGDPDRLPAPGASVHVRVPEGPAQETLVIPATALRKGPDGDHVFVVAPAADGQVRAQLRRVETAPASGDEVKVLQGLEAGEQVATSGSFKLRDGLRVVTSDAATR